MCAVVVMMEGLCGGLVSVQRTSGALDQVVGQSGRQTAGIQLVELNQLKQVVELGGSVV